MTIALSNPVTGSAQTGLTSPSYNFGLDIAPTFNGKQYAVLSLGGTQTGVNVNSPGNPFTINFIRPTVLKTAGQIGVNGVTPVVNNRNKWGVTGRKGMAINSQGAIGVLVGRLEIDVPAGAENNAQAELRAFMSAFLGSLTQVSAGFGDSLVTGVV